jgi:hypothetical protein
VALGDTDVCFANTWTTSSRRSYVSFTGDIYTDEARPPIERETFAASALALILRGSTLRPSSFLPSHASTKSTPPTSSGRAPSRCAPIARPRRCECSAHIFRTRS